MKNMIFVLVCIFLLQLNPLKVFAGIDELVTYSFAKDGGTRCMKFIRSGKEVSYCLDHKLQIGADRKIHQGNGDVYVGGYVDSPNARKLDNAELIDLNNEILKFMKTQKYKSFDKNEYKKLSREKMKKILNNEPYDRERYKKLQAYNALEFFRAELATKIK